MESKINELEFEELVQNTLNHEYLLGLQRGQTLTDKGRTYHYDLSDLRNRIYVEIIKDYISIKRPEYVQKIKLVAEIIMQQNIIGLSKIFVVFGSKITVNDRQYLIKELKNNSKVEFTIFDIENIISFATKHKINYSDIFLTILGDFPAKKFREENEKLLKQENLNIFKAPIIQIFSINPFSLEESKFWWITASPSFFEGGKVELESVYKYPNKDIKGNNKANFKNINKGDFVITYDTKVTKEAYGLGIIVRITESETYLKIIFLFDNPLQRSRIKEFSNLYNSPVGKNASGPLLKLNKDAFFEIIFECVEKLEVLLQILKSDNLLVYRDIRVLNFHEENQLIESENQKSSSYSNDFQFPLNINLWWINLDLTDFTLDSFPKTILTRELINSTNYEFNYELDDLIIFFRTNNTNTVEVLSVITEVNDQNIVTEELIKFREPNSISILQNGIDLKNTNFRKNIQQQILKLTYFEFHGILKLLNEDEEKIFPKYQKLTRRLNFIKSSKDTNFFDNRKIKQSEPILADQGGLDSLNFTKDTQSLATLLALKEMKPPIAIALLGDWGSGKSYFMDLLKKQIQMLSKFQNFYEFENSLEPLLNIPEEKPFVEGIAHIYFNAWSYMDANLWAGLAHSMFEKLNTYISDNTKSEIERLKVQATLATRLNVIQTDIEKYHERKKYLEEFKENIELEKSNKYLRYFSSKNDTAIVDFLSKIGLNKEQIESLTPSNIQNNLKSFVGFKNYIISKSPQLLTWLLVGVMLLMVFYGILKEFINDNYQFLINILIIIPIIIPTLLTSFKFILNRWSTIKKFKKLISDLKKPNSDKEIDKELLQLKEEISQIDGIIDILNKSIESENTISSNINQAAISNLISSRTDNSEYNKHLGIITSIRKDFETLSELFSDFEEENKNKYISLDQEKQTIQSAFIKGRKLERIILYIDDLDRCPDEKVLEVLQAVHLLMAFPLFIVVVGVDERCVQNALNYNQLLKYKGIDQKAIENKFHVIEPNEYLEKIFQIPFQLPNPTNESIQNLVDNLIPITQELNSKVNEEQVVDETKEIEEHHIDEEDNKDQNSENVDSTSSTHFDDEINQEISHSSLIELDRIGITSFEKNYLKKLAPLVGSNPRKIKRFVNIFRIVKTHENSGFVTDKDSLKIMFTIALSIGNNKNLAIQLFDSENTNHPLIDGIKDRSLKSKEFWKLYEEDELFNEILSEPIFNFMNSWIFVKRFSFKLDNPVKK